MKIHHLNCTSFCPVGGKLVNRSPALLVCHCLLIESDNGLILVDSGFGISDMRNTFHRLGPTAPLIGARMDESEAAINQVRALGFSPSDVQHIVLTHMDLDHAGGIADFPHAQIHVYRPEHEAAMARRTFIEKQRYKKAQWAHGPKWNLYEDFGEKWFGFDSVRELKGLPPEILLVPVVGHTRGHCAVAVETGENWLLHAGDSYFYEAEVNSETSASTPILGLYQKWIALDDRKRLENQRRLRELARAQSGRVRVFCAHDPSEFEKLR